MAKAKVRMDIDAPPFNYVDRSSGALHLTFINAPPLERAQHDVRESAMVGLFWCQSRTIRRNVV